LTTDSRCIFYGWAEKSIRELNEAHRLEATLHRDAPRISRNFLCRLVQAAKIYVEESEVGE
jgi:hypothetical protein